MDTREPINGTTMLVSGMANVGPELGDVRCGLMNHSIGHGMPCPPRNRCDEDGNTRRRGAGKNMPAGAG